MRVIRHRPSPALILGVLALCAALAGTAAAGPEATTSAPQLTGKFKKQVRKLVRKQARKQIEKQALGLDVNSALTAETLTGKSLLYAQVASNGSLIAGSPGVSSSKPGGSGFYRVNLGRSPNGCAVVGTGTLAEIGIFKPSASGGPNEVDVFTAAGGQSFDSRFDVLAFC